MEIFLTLLFIFPAMLGVSEILHFLKLKILYTKKPSIYYSVVILNNDSPLEQLNHIVQQYLWHGKSYSGTIVAINSFLNEENFSLCKQVAEKYNIMFCSLEELKTILSFD